MGKALSLIPHGRDVEPGQLSNGDCPRWAVPAEPFSGRATLPRKECEMGTVPSVKWGLVYEFQGKWKFTNPFFREWLMRGI